ncbi:hypothetical protein J2Z75_000455 [Rhizobium herbae]|uniref:Uncharacterized protein n=1 Tax=Rhizobium herbae TaxID=508661 RepID=A0ABS4EGA6_9HYPH|nr:hypothetical protein [Rhizobium herbae]
MSAVYAEESNFTDFFGQQRRIQPGAVASDNQLFVHGHAEPAAVFQKTVVLRGHVSRRLTYVEKIDCQYLLVAAADLSQQKIGAAVEDADFGNGAAEVCIFLALQKREENKSVGRIDIPLDRLEIMEYEFSNG